MSIILKTRGAGAVNDDALSSIAAQAAKPQLHENTVQLVAAAGKTSKVPHKLGRKPVSAFIAQFSGSTAGLGMVSFDSQYVFVTNSGAAVRLWVVVQ